MIFGAACSCFSSFVTAVRLRAEDVVCGNIIEFTQSYKMSDGHFVGTAFIPGVHGLRGTKDLGNVCLGKIVILSESPNNFNKRFHFAITPAFVFQQCSKVKIFTIDFSKQLYYNLSSGIFDSFVEIRWGFCLRCFQLGVKTGRSVTEVEKHEDYKESIL